MPCDDTKASSADVEMLKKIHEKGKEAEEQDNKYKVEMTIHGQAKFEMQQR
jgi:hypothetical protein